MKESTFPFSASSLETSLDRLVLTSALNKRHPIDFTYDLFHEENVTINRYLEGRAALFVISETVFELYGKKISHFLQLRKQSFDSRIVVVKSGEHHKTLDTVAHICEAANQFSLKRNHPIVGVGGGICLDECGLAAALFRRGVPHIKIPTTLVGLIDAGIATKNGVNLGKKKNLLGTFYPPEATLIDPLFLQTLPSRHMVCGIAESIKMGLVVEKRVYDLWLKVGQDLVFSNFQQPQEQAVRIITLSIESMLRELSANLYEHNDYKRAVDFGHTFSQYIEQTTAYEVLHGEAVAIDMALSCQISYLKGLITQTQLNEIMDLFKCLQLPCYHDCMDPGMLWQSLSSIMAHRGGHLNLVLPHSIGKCVFLKTLEDLSQPCLEMAVALLKNYHETWCDAMVS